MSVDVYDYESNDLREVSKAGAEEERKIEGVTKQPVDKDTRERIDSMREFFKNNKEVSDKFNQYRKKLFTSEYSTNDADLRFAERVSRLEQVVGDLQKKLQGGIQSDIEKQFGDSKAWKQIFPPEGPIFKPDFVDLSA